MEKITPTDPITRSSDPVAENIARLKELFPELLTEGAEGASVNVDVLKQLVGDSTVTDAEEKFGLSWHGKRQARRLALTPSTGTLRPCPEESVDWDTTQNLMIEGDNLEVLKLLQKSYAGKVKLIYIDPPYNTGKDFVYPDDYRDSIRNYLELTGQVVGGRKTSSNTEASGRFHTDWLNMMYPRLLVARNLLRSDGLLFVSIDDNEVANLREMLDALFGAENFEGHIHWRRRHNQPNDPTKMIALVAEHIVCYAKNSAEYRAAGVGKLGLSGAFSNPDHDPRGDWSSKPWKVGSGQSGTRYKIVTPAGVVYDEEWMGEEATYLALLADKRIVFPNSGRGLPRKKYFRSEREAEGQSATNWWHHDQFGSNQAANSAMEALLGEKNVFNNPKPLELLAGILSVGNVREDDVVVDFFAGSGATGHAVMARNAADGGQRRYILAQLPEPLDPGNEDQKVAATFCDKLGRPRNIAELTKERLRRAAAKVKADNPMFAGDSGFRVFKLDATNIQEWEPNRDDLAATLDQSLEHLKADRTEQDILFELLLKLGLDLCFPIATRTIGGKEVHAVGGGVLIACLATGIAPQEVEELGLGIAAWREELAPAAPATCVFRDSAFPDDIAKSNLTAILEQHGIERRKIQSL